LFLRWSLGFSLFLELLSALAMLQGSHFLLLVHLSRTKSELWELFYHITREVQEVSNLLGNYRHCEEPKAAKAIPRHNRNPEQTQMSKPK